MAQFVQHSIFDLHDDQPPGRALLAPEFSNLGGIVQSALQEYSRLYSDRDSGWDASTKATVRHDLMEHFATHFSNEADGWASLAPYQQSSHSTFNGIVLVRYKKLDRYRRTRNVLTIRQKQLLSGQFDLFRNQIKHSVVVGEQLAKTGIPSKIIIVEHSGKYEVWSEEFSIEDASLTNWKNFAPPFAPGANTGNDALDGHVQFIIRP